METLGIPELERERVAGVFGYPTWSGFLAQARAGRRMVVGGPLIGVAGPAWDQIRLSDDLVQVRVGRNWEVGVAASFTADEIAEDLTFDQMAAAFDDFRMPVACPRARARGEDAKREMRKRTAEMQFMKRSMIGLLAGGAVVLLLVAARMFIAA